MQLVVADRRDRAGDRREHADRDTALARAAADAADAATVAGRATADAATANAATEATAAISPTRFNIQFPPLGLPTLRRRAGLPVGRSGESRWSMVTAFSRFTQVPWPNVRWAIQPGESPLFGSERGCDQFEQRLLRFEGTSEERSNSADDEVLYVLSGNGRATIAE